MTSGRINQVAILGFLCYASQEFLQRLAPAIKKVKPFSVPSFKKEYTPRQSFLLHFKIHKKSFKGVPSFKKEYKPRQSFLLHSNN